MTRAENIWGCGEDSGEIHENPGDRLHMRFYLPTRTAIAKDPRPPRAWPELLGDRDWLFGFSGVLACTEVKNGSAGFTALTVEVALKALHCVMHCVKHEHGQSKSSADPTVKLRVDAQAIQFVFRSPDYADAITHSVRIETRLRVGMSTSSTIVASWKCR